MKNLFCVLVLPCLSLAGTVLPISHQPPDAFSQPDTDPSEPKCEIGCHNEVLSGCYGTFSLRCGGTGIATYVLEGQVCECAKLKWYKSDYCYAYYEQEGEQVYWAFSKRPDCEWRTKHSVYVKAMTSPLATDTWRHFQCACLHKVKGPCP
jgi:hypothetical protein